MQYGKRIAKYKQRKEFVGTSLEDAKAADGKRKIQKKEGHIFEFKKEAAADQTLFDNF